MIIYQHRIYRIDLQNNPEITYVFGDNLLQVGIGGQAGEMRGEPNALGIPTKRHPGMKQRDFFHDTDTFAESTALILPFVAEFTRHNHDGIVVVPSDGIGTGLSEMPTHCPKLFEWLCAFGLGGSPTNSK